MLTIQDLTCEYRTNPLGIDVTAPRLSWKLVGDQAGLRQSAYRILAASAPALLVDGKADLWDSGRAYVLRDGVYYQGYWRRTNREEGTALELIYGDSTPIKLEPGRTWVTVVRWLGDVQLSEEPADMQATATVLAASFTPTYTITPGPSQTPEATLAAP